MTAATKVILLERIEKLGNLGDIVNVKPGFARNYLLPQQKALRANDANIAYFEAQKKQIQAENDKKKAEAQKLAKDLEGAVVALIRQASEGGQLYGSVTGRDIADEIGAQTKVSVARSSVTINYNFKMIGLFPVEVVLHPEVKVEVTVNVARTQDEADIQAKTGKALIADDLEIAEEPEITKEEAEEALKEALSEEALEAEKARIEEEAAKNAEEAEKLAEKAAKKAAKEAEKVEAESAAAEAEEGAKAEEAAEAASDAEEAVSEEAEENEE